MVLYFFIIISQHPRQETNILSPEGLPMSNAAEIMLMCSLTMNNKTKTFE